MNLREKLSGGLKSIYDRLFGKPELQPVKVKANNKGKNLKRDSVQRNK